MIGRVTRILQYNKSYTILTTRLRPPLSEIFKYLYKKSKDKVMYEAHLKYGYTLKEIAEYIGMDYATE